MTLQCLLSDLDKPSSRRSHLSAVLAHSLLLARLTSVSRKQMIRIHPLPWKRESVLSHPAAELGWVLDETRQKARRKKSKKLSGSAAASRATQIRRVPKKEIQTTEGLRDANVWEERTVNNIDDLKPPGFPNFAHRASESRFSTASTI